MPSWRLLDAAQIAAGSKYTFYRPSDASIGKIAVGETVKLIFEFDNDDPSEPSAERMWVLVDAIDGQGHFRGRLDNEPYWIKDLQPDDRIEFRDIHIINTEHDDDDNIVRKYLPRCFVTSRVLYDGERIGRLWREEPEQENDSGWRIIAGDETQEYMDDSDNVAYVSLGAVLNRDDSVLSLLDAPVGSSFERAPGGEGFVSVEDEEPS